MIVYLHYDYDYDYYQITVGSSTAMIKSSGQLRSTQKKEILHPLESPPHFLQAPPQHKIPSSDLMPYRQRSRGMMHPVSYGPTQLRHLLMMDSTQHSLSPSLAHSSWLDPQLPHCAPQHKCLLFFVWRDTIPIVQKSFKCESSWRLKPEKGIREVDVNVTLLSPARADTLVKTIRKVVSSWSFIILIIEPHWKQE